MRILVVDDSLLVRRKAREALEGAGHACDVAENGLEGLKLVLRGGYDLVITDVRMPVLDGFRFLQRLRAAERTRTVPVLMLTAGGDRESVELAGRLGVQGFLLKPLRPELLLARVAGLESGLPGRGSGRPGP